MRKPDMDSQHVPAITVFRDRTGWLCFFLVFGVVITIQAIVTGGIFIVYLADDLPFLIAGVGLSFALLIIGYWFSGYAWRRMRDPENPIMIGPSGLHDRATSERPIKWDDLRDIHIWNAVRGGPVIVYDLANGAADRAGVFARTRRWAWLNRVFGYSYLVHSYGTDATPTKLITAIAPYADVSERSP